mmetsp:Transcript_147092/g.409773  ORF Transcript_147092/g.409773 Transcript_147092/m.409773 type:complete len:334 (-) Transcript_147092:103-1104(-)|eukprot:CAMPEP_0179037688 /NCGR_PEP_ID=MMETSP0796-20121207/14255_1 /TAXON_ID=73915 /ORGANISM="Pyrodinium bahamense, Strain pbaha01" /LENGTH=333 /DNA_ID=CAMNT_0020733999 /DNA_START=99 /DNA_END=1100 /DNA_ORIENTATION=+
MLSSLKAQLMNPHGSAVKLEMGIMKRGVSTEDRIDFIDGFDRKKTAALLFFGAIFGLLGFVFAFVIGLMTFMHPFLSDFHVKFPSGYGYFPATVSEMVHDPATPAGKCFFAFEFVGAFLLFESWYPWRLRSVYIGDNASLPGIPVSWMMFRQFIPPTGMMLVATVTTTPFAQANILDYFCIGIHLTGAVMLFAGYAIVEAITLGWGPFNMPDVASRTIKSFERKCRKICINGIVFWYVIFCLLQGVLLLPLEDYGIPGQSDQWTTIDTKDKYDNPIKEVTLVDTASGFILFLKITSYASEVFCGLFLITSFMVIWYFCHERFADLSDELTTIK